MITDLAQLNFSTTSTLVAQRCPSCHIVFGIPTEMNDRLLTHKANGRSVDTAYCPNGHAWWYTGKSEAEILKERMSALERDANWQRERRQEADRATERVERRRRAIKGQMTKLRKRIAAGVCPCCKRTFENLARHMAGQHPEFPLPLDEIP